MSETKTFHISPAIAEHAIQEYARLKKENAELLAMLRTVAPMVNGMFSGKLPACFRPREEIVNDMNRLLKSED